MPFALAALWWQLRPAVAPLPGRLLWLALAGLLLAAGGAVAYGLSRRDPPGERYVPARVGPDGRVVPGRAPP